MSAVRLWRACDFDMSIAVWGYELTGDATEVSALAAETPELVEWDRDSTYLDRFHRWHGGVRVPVPEWWALPHVVDQEIAS